jgi:hypothetical protein
MTLFAIAALLDRMRTAGAAAGRVTSARRDKRERLWRMSLFEAGDGWRHRKTSPYLHAQDNLCMQFRHIACT